MGILLISIINNTTPTAHKLNVSKEAWLQPRKLSRYEISKFTRD